MNKIVLFALPGAAFPVIVLQDSFEGEEIERYTLFHQELPEKLPTIVNDNNVDEIMLVGGEGEFIAGLGKQVYNILENEDVTIIIVNPEENNA